MDPNSSEIFESKDNLSVTISHQFHFRNTTKLVFSPFKTSQGRILLYNPFTDSINQFQNILHVTKQSIRSNDLTFMLKTITTAVLAMSGTLLATQNFADTYSLSNTINIPFRTYTKLIATANPPQTL